MSTAHVQLAEQCVKLIEQVASAIMALATAKFIASSARAGTLPMQLQAEDGFPSEYESEEEERFFNYLRTKRVYIPEKCIRMYEPLSTIGALYAIGSYLLIYSYSGTLPHEVELGAVREAVQVFMSAAEETRKAFRVGLIKPAVMEYISYEGRRLSEMLASGDYQKASGVASSVSTDLELAWFVEVAACSRAV